MTVTREDLAAFADGELDPARAAEVAAAVAADPALDAQVRAHQALKARLGAHFAPIAEAPVPDRLTALLKPEAAKVVSLDQAREKRQPLPARWTWFAAPALAASLALAVFWPRGAGPIDGPVANVLENQLVATQPADADPRILLSFRNAEGDYCRAFASSARSGIACRDSQGWVLRENLAASVAQTGEYRQAGNPAVEIMERAQAMAAGPALDAGQEQAAKARGWR